MEQPFAGQQPPPTLSQLSLILSTANEVQQRFVAFARFLDYCELIDALECLTKVGPRTGYLGRSQEGVGDVVRKKATSRQRINRSNREGGSSK
jgi:hypothetical protein